MSESEKESEKDSDEEILITSSESETGEESGPGAGWEMEVDETAANQDSMSPYEFEDDNMGSIDDAPPTPMPGKRRVEINYESPR